MTQQLYYQDTHVLEFTATVESAERVDDGLRVRLNRTAFYPEGGGQPSDLGTLDGVRVVHVRKQEGEIYHMLALSGDATADAAKGNDAFRAGAEVRGVVDRARRRDYMQQHTGQHIISAALMTVGGYRTVSVHLGEEYSTIEIDAPSIPASDLLAAENAANAAIELAAPVSATVVNDAEVGSYSLRRPPKVSGAIRLVTVEGVDCVACGGVHVDNSRDVRLVHLMNTESIRGRVRLYWKIGDRALADYRLAGSIVRELGDLLSAKPHELAERVRKQEDRIREAEASLKGARERICTLAAGQVMSRAVQAGSTSVATAEFQDEEKDFLTGVAKVLAVQDDLAVCMTNRSGDLLQWCVVISPDAAIEFSMVRDRLLPLIGGKGGGKPPIWQGAGTRPETTGDFLAEFGKLAGAL